MAGLVYLMMLVGIHVLNTYIRIFIDKQNNGAV